MALEMIQVRSQEGEGWGEWALRCAKERSYLAALAAPAAVAAAPFVATTAATVGAATVVGAAVAGLGELFFGPSEKPKITFYSVEEAEGMVDVHDQPLLPSLTYLRHPKRSETSVLFRSSDFHGSILSEKVSEIINYLRAETKLEYLSILVQSSEGRRADIKGHIKSIPVSAEAKLDTQHQRGILMSYDKPSRMAHQRRYIWIDEFPEVKAAAKRARRGKVSFRQSSDMAFGMSVDAAKLIRVEAEWLTTFVIEIEAVFA